MLFKSFFAAGLMTVAAASIASAQYLDREGIGLPLQIPVSFSNLTVDTMAAVVECHVTFSDGKTLARGKTYLFSDVVDSEGAAVRRLLPEGATAIQVPNLDGYTDVVEVMLEPDGDEYLIDAWTEGYCEFRILAVPLNDDNTEVFESITRPCTDSVYVTVAFCEREGSESVGCMKFSRDPFFDPNAEN